MQPCSPLALLVWLQVGQYHVPKDTVVHINLWGMQHDEQYWQDAEAFRPERWLGDKTGGDKSGGMAYMPFGLGPRMCIGIKLACELPCVPLYLAQLITVAVSLYGHQELQVSCLVQCSAAEPVLARVFQMSLVVMTASAVDILMSRCFSSRTCDITCTSNNQQMVDMSSCYRRAQEYCSAHAWK